MKHLTECKKLFATFFKIGAFTFGGGYAMIPLIHVETHQWITDEDMLNILAIAESTPGPISINSATFIGYQVAGVLGAVCSTFGVVLPSFVVISILSLFIMQYKRIQWLAWMFDGIRAGVAVLVVNAVLKMGKQCPRTNFSAVLILLAFLGAAFLRVDVILLLVAAAAAGILRQILLARRTAGKEGPNDASQS